VKDFQLSKVGVLELVYQYESGMFPFAGKQLVVPLEQGMRARNHVTEGAEVVFGEHAFNSGKDVGDFTATPQHFFIGKRQSIFRLRHSGDRQFLALEAADVFSVLFGTNKFVLAATHEVEQVIEKLTHLGSPDEIVQVQLANTFSEINPEIFFIENSELLATTSQQGIAVGVKGSDLPTRKFISSKLRMDAFAHFSGRVFSELSAVCKKFSFRTPWSPSLQRRSWSPARI